MIKLPTKTKRDRLILQRVAELADPLADELLDDGLDPLDLGHLIARTAGRNPTRRMVRRALLAALGAAGWAHFVSADEWHLIPA